MNKLIPYNLQVYIKRKKSLSIGEYINFCLFNSKNGYYQKQKSVGHDFITSPEISQLFGESVAFLFLYLKTKKLLNHENRIIELGPGNGTLTLDMINILKKNKIIKKINFKLIEKSEVLKKKQIKKLKNFRSSVIEINWKKQIDLKNHTKPIFFVGNEFFDALPINQFIFLKNSWIEKRVSINNEGNLFFSYKKTQKKIPNYYQNSTLGSLIEYSNLAKKILSKIFSYLSSFGGAFLIIDYGPLKKQKIDTLQSIYKNKKCGFFDYPCMSDITHHIDFEYIIDLSKKYKLKHFGPVSQKEFLFKLGINERLNILINSAKNTREIISLKNGFNRLVNSKEMGDLFKCVLFTNKNFQLD